MLARPTTLALITLALAGPVAAQEVDPVGPTDPVEINAFIDGTVELLLSEYETAGAVVTIVRDGDVIFAEGYGFADVEARTPVDPERTLFRIGSVSKLFTWLSVMQQVERGELDLDADLNQYVDFEIPEAFGGPVTLSHIMAHAAGFEDYIIELFGDEPEDVIPMGEIFARHMPERVRPAGDISSYSNHGTGMAAYAVERATGTDWLDYVEQEILEPLGMENTTFRQPVPDHLAAQASKGYSRSNNRFVEGDFEYVPLAGVGAASASGVDMARFMIAMLQLGQLDSVRVLEEETARQMQSVHHRMADGVNGMAHGFMEMSRNGQHVIGHGGDTNLFHTNLALFPEHDLGVFVSFNSVRGGGARSTFMTRFYDHYFPVDSEPPEIPEDFAERGDRFTGEFRANRFSHSTLLKLNALGGNVVEIGDDGALHAVGVRWAEVAPLTFDEIDGDRTLIFREESDGSIDHFFLSTTSVVAWERVPLYEIGWVHFPMMLFNGVMIGLVLLTPWFGWMMRRWYGVRDHELERLPAVARLTLWVACAMAAASFAVVDATMGSIATTVPPALIGGLWGLIAATIPTTGALWFAARAWRDAQGRPVARVGYSLAVLALLLMYWQLGIWNVVPWNV